MKLDGRQIASEILENLKTQVSALSQKGIVPMLLVILIGDNEESARYVRQKELKAAEIGAKTQVMTFEDSMTYEQAKKIVEKSNADKNIHGIIIQRPAPESLRVGELAELIDPKKEIDGFGHNALYPVPVAEATLILIENAFKQSDESGNFEEWLKEKNIVVIGKGETAGKPIIEHLQKLGVSPTIVDSKTQNPKEVTLNADILISAVGKQDTVSPDMIKKGAILIGVGLFVNTGGKLSGDFDQEEIEDIVSFYSPTPGGIGPVNVACLMKNLVKSAAD